MLLAMERPICAAACPNCIRVVRSRTDVLLLLPLPVGRWGVPRPGRRGATTLAENRNEWVSHLRDLLLGRVLLGIRVLLGMRVLLGGILLLVATVAALRRWGGTLVGKTVGADVGLTGATGCVAAGVCRRMSLRWEWWVAALRQGRARLRPRLGQVPITTAATFLPAAAFLTRGPTYATRKGAGTNLGTRLAPRPVDLDSAVVSTASRTETLIFGLVLFAAFGRRGGDIRSRRSIWRRI